MISKLADLHYLSAFHGGAFAAPPKIAVVHATQSDSYNGMALRNAMYLANTAKLSCHYLIDPGEIVAGLDETLIGYGAGTVNTKALHFEFCGWSAWTRAQWAGTGAEGTRAMIDRGTRLLAEVLPRHKIPLRLVTDAQLKAAWTTSAPGGIATHDQCRRVIGGTTHTDPGSGFPLDLLLAKPPAPTAHQEDDMKATDHMKVRDAYQASKGKSADRTLTVEQAIQTAYNYGSVAARDVAALKAQIASLTAQLAALKGQKA